ncbi:group II intron maturase-specific domain-containing protein [Streptomyces sp. NPDC005574]|uniref:group II intron maturase-specific domain-containing protein n=1 Tax=Streptomyces sp. NPDC005574 TaxID=3156891 RepID=UPI00339EFCF2
MVSSKTFSALDSYVWTLTYKWAKRTHPKKSKHWIVNKYFDRLNRSKNNNWVFDDRTTGAHLQVRLDQHQKASTSQGKFVT